MKTLSAIRCTLYAMLLAASASAQTLTATNMLAIVECADTSCFIQTLTTAGFQKSVTSQGGATGFGSYFFKSNTPGCDALTNAPNHQEAVIFTINQAVTRFVFTTQCAATFNTIIKDFEAQGFVKQPQVVDGITVYTSAQMAQWQLNVELKEETPLSFSYTLVFDKIMRAFGK